MKLPVGQVLYAANALSDSSGRYVPARHSLQAVKRQAMSSSNSAAPRARACAGSAYGFVPKNAAIRVDRWPAL